MVESRKDVTNGYISQDMTDANDNFITIWPYLTEIEDARGDEASLSAKIEAIVVGEIGNIEVSLDGFLATSTSTLEVSTGTKTFDIESGKNFQAGQYVTIASSADASDNMCGVVSFYSGTILSVIVSSIHGSGTYSSWNVSLSGASGTDGVDGADGVNGADGADGLPGADGTDGADGLPGADGEDGVNAGNWSSDIVFTSTDYNTVAWTSGTITSIDNSFSIVSGHTGNMAANTPYYIYLKPSISIAALQVTTAAASAVGVEQVLVAVAFPSSDTSSKAQFQAFGGRGGVFINADNIAANCITADKIAANSLTSSEINTGTISVGDLSGGTTVVNNAAAGATFTSAHAGNLAYRDTVGNSQVTTISGDKINTGSIVSSDSTMEIDLDNNEIDMGLSGIMRLGSATIFYANPYLKINAANARIEGSSTAILKGGGVTIQSTTSAYGNILYDGEVGHTWAVNGSSKAVMSSTQLSPSSSSSMFLGSSSAKWWGVHASAFYDDGVLLADTLDDLYIMSQYQPKIETTIDEATGKKKYGKNVSHPETGGEVLDIHSLPRWMTNYDDVAAKLKADNGDLLTDQDIEQYLKDDDGAQWLLGRNLSAFNDLTSGAVRQLDTEVLSMFELMAARITKLENIIKTKLGEVA